MHQLDRLCYAVVVLVVIGATVAEAATGTFIYAGCSPSKYQPGTPFEGNLNSLLASIANAAANGGYNSFTAGSNGTGDGAAAYGLYQCRGDLGNADCAACVRDAVGQLNEVCAAAYAASLQLEGCYVRYDSSNFVGQPDNAMVYRKCSTSTSGDGDFLKNRDAVLAALQGGLANGYKVSSSGNVQGVSQCLGDLAAGDCTTCLAQAVGQLKGTCGTSLAADVYLAQCYVRYWANGFYFRPSQDYSQDDVGRTVAIIVGILAGLAILVVFISFLRKSWDQALCPPSVIGLHLAEL
uniref:Gnk2-homologous domain-containing protein n=1 Tax=Oryza glumipatula TaxID=40148 RepID=A0A0D9ZNL0_9ORYZ